MQNRPVRLLIMLCLFALTAPVTAEAISVTVTTPDLTAADIHAKPTPRPDGALLLADDFTDAGQSALPSFAEEWMRWTVADGVGVMASSAAGDELSAQYLEPIVADLAVEVDLRAVTTAVEGTGVILRSTNLRDAGEARAWHYYHIGVRPDDRMIELGILTEGAEDVSTLDDCPLPPSLSDITRFRRLRVETVSAQMRIFVDDAFVCALTTDQITTPGRIGLYLGVPEDISSKSEAVVEFTRLRVYALTTTAQPTPDAQPTVAVPPPPTPIDDRFEDDFSTEDSRWWTGADDNGAVRYANGALLIRNLTAADHRSQSTPGIGAADLTLDVDSWLVDGTDDNWQSIFCRRTPGGTYFSASFSADGYYGASLFLNDEVVREQSPERTAAVRQGWDQVNHARIACVGDQLRFWVNDELLLDWSDDRLTEGEFGLAASALAGEFTEVAFDNVVVTFGAGVDTQPAADVAALEVIVTAPTLNVRSGPGASYFKIGAVREGDRLPVLEANAGCTWVKVVTPTTMGWVSTSYVTLTGPCLATTPAAPQPAATPAAPTPTISAATTATGSPIIADFEAFGVWRRGDETWGEFRQSGAQVYAGAYAGALTYDFPANVPGDRNYVVFMRTLPIPGVPDELTMQVFGDGSGSLLNVWVKDAVGQVWQFSFGAIDHIGWKQMTAPLDTTLDWPVQPISGSATTLSYPLSLNALVLDYPTATAATGTVYFDDLTAVYPE